MVFKFIKGGTFHNFGRGNPKGGKSFSKARGAPMEDTMSMVDSALHPSVVDKMSTRDSWELGG